MAVGRFQVMAVLQAARAVILGLAEPSAKSWGLNRAIFYAAAKRGFKAKPPMPRPKGEIAAKPLVETKETLLLGDEMAYKAQREKGALYFIIGDKVQTEDDFRRQIESRFSGNFEQAWSEALDLVRQFDHEILLSQNRFFEQVYRPNRDLLATKWTGLVSE
ncbi:MAG: hypothetical protein ACFFDP_08895 [Promethearchaeota archaeon]